MSRKLLWLLVLFVGVGAAIAQTKTPNELLQDGIYAEQIEGNLDKAIGLYDQVINSKPVSPPFAAQAMYHKSMCFLKQHHDTQARATLETLVHTFQEQTAVIEKAKTLLADLSIVDPASIMPPNTLVYWESGNPGLQIEHILSMLQGTPFANPLALMHHASNGGNGVKGPGDVIAALFNPSMMAEFKKIRGMAVGISGVSGDNGPPPMTVVMYPGQSDALRGMIMAGLQMAGQPGADIGEFKTLSIQGQLDVAYNKDVFILAHPHSQLVWAVNQYIGKTHEPSLLDNHRFFSQVSKKDRQENALTLWADVNGTYARVQKMFGGHMPPQMMAAEKILDLPHIEELMSTLTLQSDGVRWSAKLNFNKGANCLAYNLIRTPALTPRGFQGVPSDAVALVSLALSDANPQQVQMFSQKLKQVTGLDIGRELFANIKQINLFLTSQNGTTAQSWPGLPAIVMHVGIAISSHDPSHTGALLREALSVADTMTHSLAGKPKPRAQDDRFLLGMTHGKPLYCYLGQAGQSTFLSLSPTGIQAATQAVQQHLNVTQGGPLSQTVSNLPRTTSKLILVNPGGILPLVAPHLGNLPAEALSQLSQACAKTLLKLTTDETDQALDLNVGLRGLPPLRDLMPPLMQIQKTMTAQAAQAHQKAMARQAAQRKAQIPISPHKIESAPQIDGQVDALWQKAKVYTLKHSLYQPIQGPNDLSANFRVLCDDQALYLLVDVTDDHLIKDSSKFYDDDSIEVFINTDTPLKYVVHGFSAENAQLLETRHNRTQDVGCAVKQTASGYRAELRLPWSTLKVTPDKGQTFPFDVHINDDDNGGARDSKLMWHDTADKAGSNTEVMGRLQIPGMVGQWSFDDKGGVLTLTKPGDAVITQDKTDLPVWTAAVKVKADAAPADTDPACPMTREVNYQINWDHMQPEFRGAAGVRVNRHWYTASFGDLKGQRWVTLVATYDGENLKAYKDGVLISDNNEPSGPADNDDHPLIFGKNYNFHTFFKGSIDETRLYNFALNADEVQNLVQSLSKTSQ